MDRMGTTLHNAHWTDNCRPECRQSSTEVEIASPETGISEARRYKRSRRVSR